MVASAKKITFFAAAVWTVIVAASIIWNIHLEEIYVMNMAASSARLAFDRDMAFRSWATSHGGAYVPLTDETPSNPYLDIPEKNASTELGRSLTLMNPAYIMRQLYEKEIDQGGIGGHITSLKPLRPENSPDPWEKDALIKFEKGEKEAFLIEKIDGMEYLRFMRPFITEKGCLKCHARQGYKEGEIRGGVSLTIPITSMRVSEKKHIKNMMLWHIILWVSGLGGIGLFGLNVVRNHRKQRQINEMLKAAEEKMAKIFNNSPEWITITALKDGKLIEVNKAFEKATGYSREEIIGKTTVELGIWVNPEKRSSLTDLFQKQGYLENEEIYMKMFSGEIRSFLWSVQPIWIEGEECMLNFARDITDKTTAIDLLRRSEERLRAFVAYSTEGIWCFEIKEPFAVTLLPEEQIDLFYENTYLIECNEAMAKMHGYSRAEDMIGNRLGAFIPRLSKENVKYLKEFIESGYMLADRESREVDITGKVKYYLNSNRGIVENGYLLRIWGMQRDITEQKRLEKELQTIAITDPLTGLYNRRGFVTLAEQQLNISDRTKKGLYLSFIDLDGMKSINDVWGHEEGDFALISAARALKDTFRKSDIIARVGGDEFAVLAVNITDTIPDMIESRLNKNIERINEEVKKPYELSMSIGIAVYDPEKPRSLDEFMAEADILMYEEKEKKKNKNCERGSEK